MPSRIGLVGPRVSVAFSSAVLDLQVILPRVKAKLRNGDIVIPGDHWPILLYARYEYNSEDPWKGLFRSSILVSVSLYYSFTPLYSFIIRGLQTRLHITQLRR